MHGYLIVPKPLTQDVKKGTPQRGIRGDGVAPWLIYWRIKSSGMLGFIAAKGETISPACSRGQEPRQGNVSCNLEWGPARMAGTGAWEEEEERFYCWQHPQWGKLPEYLVKLSWRNHSEAQNHQDHINRRSLFPQTIKFPSVYADRELLIGCGMLRVNDSGQSFWFLFIDTVDNYMTENFRFKFIETSNWLDKTLLWHWDPKLVFSVLLI